MSSFKSETWLKSQIKANLIRYFDYNEFSDLTKVGEGGSGSVSKANWESRRMTVALKFFKPDVNNSDTNEEVWKEFVRELTHLRNVFYHPHINLFIGITKGDGFDYAMVLQYADGGNLRSYLNNSENELTWSDKCRIALEISEGLTCLHKESIIHKDLHSKNVLVHQNKMLIADFGVSMDENSMSSNSTSLRKGMAAYIDPQCHKQLKYRRSKKSDIFSLGMVLWEISSRKVPFAGFDDLAVLMKITNGIREKRVDGTPDEYFKLYTRCWDDEPSKRPDIEVVVGTLEKIAKDMLPKVPTINVTPTVMDSEGALSKPTSIMSNASYSTTAEHNMMMNHTDEFVIDQV